jgi:hypothetical protein
MLVNLAIQRCPACGRVLHEGSHIMGGHIMGIEVGKTSFGYCEQHEDKAKESLNKRLGKQSMGYYGEWEPRLGLVAEIEHDDGRREIVTIIEGSEK